MYNFKLLRANLRAKKNNESEIRLTPHSAQRQDNIAVANMHVGIQYLFNKLQPGVLFKQYDFGSPTDIHTYLTEMFQTHFQAQPTPAPDLNAGSLQWNDILTGNHADFQRRHSGLNIPLPTGDRQEALLAHWQSLSNVPNRHQVSADLQSVHCDHSLKDWSFIGGGGPPGVAILAYSELAPGYGQSSLQLSGHHLDQPILPGLLEMEVASPHAREKSQKFRTSDRLCSWRYFTNCGLAV